MRDKSFESSKENVAPTNRGRGMEGGGAGREGADLSERTVAFDVRKENEKRTSSGE